MSYKCNNCDGTGEIPNTEYLLADADMCWTCMGSGRVKDRRPIPRYDRREAEPVKVNHRLVPRDTLMALVPPIESLDCFVDKQGFVRVQQRTFGSLPRRTEDTK